MCRHPCPWLLWTTIRSGSQSPMTASLTASMSSCPIRMGTAAGPHMRTPDHTQRWRYISCPFQAVSLSLAYHILCICNVLLILDRKLIDMSAGAADQPVRDIWRHCHRLQLCGVHISLHDITGRIPAQVPRPPEGGDLRRPEARPALH